MIQTEQVINHLKITGSITNREALLDYQIASLSKVISTLRAEGYVILGTWRKHPITRNNYKRYWVTDRENIEIKVSHARDLAPI
tara:strand:- start:201 stop:452 length:252 start_codon:yes stop_codon:yes gene_type:complete